MSIIGTDGKNPIYDEDIPHRIWLMDDIWLGDSAEGKYVVKPKDLVYEIIGGNTTLYRVVSVDEETLIPTLKETIIKVDNATFLEADILFGVGPGTQADTYRVYIDKSTSPYTLCVDQRLQVNGTMTKTAKIFKGSTVNSSGEVISMLYDNSGNFISENIPLELVAINNHDNYAIKSIPPCKTKADLVDGEIVTAVLYGDDGGVVSKRQLLVENTAFIRNRDVSVKYISHISLECGFFSENNDHLIEFPVNLPLNSINLMGVVHYSDGSTLKLPVDGNKFQLAGLNDFVSTIVGQKVELVLIYTLSDDEVAYGTIVGEKHTMTEPYELLVTDINLDLSIKLFCYPEWQSEAAGYKLKFYMFSQDRNLWENVTPLVQFDDRTEALDGKLYGYKQFKTVYLNMKDVSSTYKNYTHVQNIEVILLRKPDGRNSLWKVKSVADENLPYYGEKTFAILKKINNSYALKIDNEKNDVSEWLKSFYDVNTPMFNSLYETTYPKPTHFYLTVDGVTTKYMVERDWNKELILSKKPSLYKNAIILFTREVGGKILYLNAIDMPIVE